MPAMNLDRIAYVATGAFLLVVTWNGLRLGGGALGNGLLVLAFVTATLYAMQSRQSIRIPGWMLVAAGGMVVAAMLNIFFPPDTIWINKTLRSFLTEFQTPAVGLLLPRSDLLALAKFLICLLLVPGLLIMVARSTNRVRLLLDLFALSCVVNATVAVLTHAGLPLQLFTPELPIPYGRESGLTVHPNYLALTCTIGIPLTLLWVTRGGRWRMVGLVATGLLLAGAIFSGSRAGGITAPLALVATVAAIPYLRRALGFVLPVVGIAMVSLLVFTNAGNDVLEELRFKGDTTTSDSDNARENLARLALDQFSARPVQGVGFQVIGDAHSVYLQLLACGGLLTLLSFFVYLFGLFDAWRRTRAGPDGDVATACAIAILMWTINGVFDAQIADKYLYVIPGLLVALSLIPQTAPAPAPQRVTRPTSRVAPPEPALTH